MIEDWRYNESKMDQRKVCLLCLIDEGFEINRSAYEFCHTMVSQGALESIAPTEDNDFLADEIRQFKGDYMAYAKSKVLTEWKSWRQVNEKRTINKESSEEAD